MHMNIKRLKSFTIIETVITILIISLLIGVIFQIYITIGYIAIFVQWQKTIHNELIYLTQSIQNLVDDQGILLNTDQYSFSTIEPNAGIIDELHLVDQELLDNDYQAIDCTTPCWRYIFDRVCEDDAGTPSNNLDDTQCYIRYTKTNAPNGVINPTLDDVERVAMTSKDFTQVNNFYVKILPYTNQTNAAFEDIFHDWFGLYLDIQIEGYEEENWWNKVRYQTQNFFTIRKY